MKASRRGVPARHGLKGNETTAGEPAQALPEGTAGSRPFNGH